MNLNADFSERVMIHSDEVARATTIVRNPHTALRSRRQKAMTMLHSSTMPASFHTWGAGDEVEMELPKGGEFLVLEGAMFKAKTGHLPFAKAPCV